MATNPTASRETRRRRIVDGGADRLALITGQIRNASPPSESGTVFSPPSDSLHAADQTQTSASVSPDEADGGFGSKLRDHEPAAVVDTAHAGGIVEAMMSERETSIEASKAASSESDGIGGRLQSSFPASMDQRSNVPASRARQCVERRARRNRHVTGKEITSAIAETERSRLFCTVAMAVLVVLSNWGFPLLGCNLVRGIVSFRPLYLVLLTNLTLVLVKLLLDDHRGSQRSSRAEPEMSSTGEADWVKQASRALEVSFVLQKAMDALLLDFSVYAIIVVCGLSLL